MRIMNLTLQGHCEGHTDGDREGDKNSDIDPYKYKVGFSLS